jgi:nitric-oxide synthase
MSSDALFAESFPKLAPGEGATGRPAPPTCTRPRSAEPTSAEPTSAEPRTPGSVDVAEALAFIEQFYAESQAEISDDLREQRLDAVRAEIDETGTYRHTLAELTFGARVAWRNSARCIGRLYWQSLRIRDRREVHAPADVAAECAAHLHEVTRGGKIRCTVTVFAPDTPARSGPRIHNEQLIRYAGYRGADGGVVGDPKYADFTDTALGRGWRPPGGAPGRFDVLPLLISEQAGGEPEMFEVPADAVSEVELQHPEYRWFAELGLRWHAVPAISDMPLAIGGVNYPAAPFNGWYMSSEIGARNLSDTDRYNLLPEIADRLWLDTSSERTLWRDRALVELMRAVQWSFDQAGVQMSDHHSESRRFLEHLSREQEAGRRCPADWSWIVPPVSGGLTPVFHRYYDGPDHDLRPAFLGKPAAPDPDESAFLDSMPIAGQ